MLPLPIPCWPVVPLAIACGALYRAVSWKSVNGLWFPSVPPRNQTQTGISTPADGRLDRTFVGCWVFDSCLSRPCSGAAWQLSSVLRGIRRAPQRVPDLAASLPPGVRARSLLALSGRHTRKDRVGIDSAPPGVPRHMRRWRPIFEHLLLGLHAVEQLPRSVDIEVARS